MKRAELIKGIQRAEGNRRLSWDRIAGVMGPDYLSLERRLPEKHKPEMRNMKALVIFYGTRGNVCAMAK